MSSLEVRAARPALGDLGIIPRGQRKTTSTRSTLRESSASKVRCHIEQIVGQAHSYGPKGVHLQAWQLKMHSSPREHARWIELVCESCAQGEAYHMRRGWIPAASTKTDYFQTRRYRGQLVFHCERKSCTWNQKAWDWRSADGHSTGEWWGHLRSTLIIGSLW